MDLSKSLKGLITLNFPTHWHIHNAFHFSLLKPYQGDPPPSSIKEDPPKVKEDEEMILPRGSLDMKIRY